MRFMNRTFEVGRRLDRTVYHKLGISRLVQAIRPKLPPSLIRFGGKYGPVIGIVTLVALYAAALSGTTGVTTTDEGDRDAGALYGLPSDEHDLGSTATAAASPTGETASSGAKAKVTKDEATSAPGKVAPPKPGYKGEVGVGSDSIKIGLIFPQSGIFGPFFEQYPKIYQAAFNEVNEKGGIYGRKIEIMTGDEGESASQAQAAARKLAPNVFGVTSFVYEKAVVQFTEEAGIPTVTTVGGAALDQVQGRSRFSFSTGTPPEFYEPRNGPSFLNGKFPKLVDRVALVYTGDAYAASGPAFLEAAKRHKVNVVHIEKLTLNQASCTNAVSRVQGATPNIVYIHASSLEAGCFFRDAATLGFRPQVWAGRLAQITNTLAGGTNEGMVGTSYLATYDSPEGRRMRAVYGKYYPNETVQNIEPNMVGWAAAQLWISFLQAAGPTPTRKDFPAAIENHGPFPNGMVGPQVYLPGIHVGSTHTVAGEVKDGNVVITDPVWRTSYDGIEDPPYFPWR